MINPKELRIGNFIEYDGEYRKVYQIMENFVYMAESPFSTITGCIKELINPIPLTKEILEKAGFTYDGEYYIKNFRLLDDFEIDHFSLFIDETTGDIKLMYYSIPITSVHQLQNLYFALTGEELEITLPSHAEAHSPKNT